MAVKANREWLGIHSLRNWSRAPSMRASCTWGSGTVKVRESGHQLSLRFSLWGCFRGLSAHAVPTSNSTFILSASELGSIQAVGDSAHQFPIHVS